MRILLLDPDEYYHDQFSEALASIGPVVASHHAHNLLELLAEESPDILIMELLLGDNSGYEVLDKLKANPRYQHLPVVIFSKVGNLADVEEALNRGVNAYFVKGQNPINDVKQLLLNYTKNAQ